LGLRALGFGENGPGIGKGVFIRIIGVSAVELKGFTGFGDPVMPSIGHRCGVVCAEAEQFIPFAGCDIDVIIDPHGIQLSARTAETVVIEFLDISGIFVDPDIRGLPGFSTVKGIVEIHISEGKVFIVFPPVPVVYPGDIDIVARQADSGIDGTPHFQISGIHFRLQQKSLIIVSFEHDLMIASFPDQKGAVPVGIEQSRRRFRSPLREIERKHTGLGIPGHSAVIRKKEFWLCIPGFFVSHIDLFTIATDLGSESAVGEEFFILLPGETAVERAVEIDGSLMIIIDDIIDIVAVAADIVCQISS
jgi:hypothetical protein